MQVPYFHLLDEIFCHKKDGIEGNDIENKIDFLIMNRGMNNKKRANLTESRSGDNDCIRPNDEQNCVKT